MYVCVYMCVCVHARFVFLSPSLCLSTFERRENRHSGLVFLGDFDASMSYLWGDSKYLRKNGCVFSSMRVSVHVAGRQCGRGHRRGC